MATTDETTLWYLKAGKKKVGPLSTGKIRRRMEKGKIPDGTKALRKGEKEWRPIEEVPEFGAEAAGTPAGSERDGPPSSAPTETAPDPVPREERAEPDPRPAKREGSVPLQGIPILGGLLAKVFPSSLALSFDQPHRIERTDLWRCFGMGLDGRRVTFALIAAGAVLGCIFAILVAGLLHEVLGLLVALGALPTATAIGLCGWGGLAWQTRRKLETGRTPGARETLSFCRRNGIALAATPLLVNLLTLVPTLGLVFLALLTKIPTAGPVLTGLVFGLHLFLGAAVLFLGLASGLAWVFGPVVVGFEETGVIETIQVLFDLVRRSAVRLVLWSLLPSLAMTGFTVLVLTVGAAVVALPLAVNAGVGGLEPRALVGAAGVPYALWTGLLGGVLFAIVGSAQAALTSLLYVAGRRGNDDSISRDVYLSRTR